MAVPFPELTIFNCLRALCGVFCDLNFVKLAGHELVKLCRGEFPLVFVISENFTDLL